MESNIDFKNLSKYKYVYKIYFANKMVYAERFPIVYISKNACYYSDGSGYLAKVNSANFCTKNEIPHICAEIISNHYYYYVP